MLRDASLNALEKREKISSIIFRTVAEKEAGRQINLPTFVKPERPMSAIGG